MQDKDRFSQSKIHENECILETRVLTENLVLGAIEKREEAYLLDGVFCQTHSFYPVDRNTCYSVSVELLSRSELSPVLLNLAEWQV